jgi:hypothetical protein
LALAESWPDVLLRPLAEVSLVSLELPLFIVAVSLLPTDDIPVSLIPDDIPVSAGIAPLSEPAFMPLFRPFWPPHPSSRRTARDGTVKWLRVMVYPFGVSVKTAPKR